MNFYGFSINDDQNENYIFSQGSKEIHKDFVGELGLYVNGALNKFYEITKKGSKLMGRLLRKYRPKYPYLTSQFAK